MREGPALSTGIAPVSSIVKSVDVVRRTVVIGEDMANRVIPFAKANGFSWFNPRGLNPTNWMRNQTQWIKRMIKDPGVEIRDIGPKGPVPTSPYYMKELEILKKSGY